MKADIHPKYFDKAVATCACGAKHEFGTTVESYSLDVCSKCHPFYTGKKTMVDIAGRVDKFKARMQTAEKLKAENAARTGGKKKKETLEEKMTRKAAEKEALKIELKAEEEEKKKEKAKKEAEKTVVKKEEVAEAPAAEEKSEE